MGADKGRLLAVLGCDEQDLQVRDRRIDAQRHNEMLAVAADDLNIPGIILQIGSRTTPDHLGVVGHLMMNSATLFDAGRHIVRYAGVLSETGRWQIEEQADCFRIHYRVNRASSYLREIEQASLSACIGTLRSLCGRNLTPLEVSLTHSNPGYAVVYQQVFGIRVIFDAPECCIAISREDGLQPVPHRQSYLLDLLQQHAQDLLRQISTTDPVTSRVRLLVTEALPQGKVDIAQISEQMHISRWTLARNLKSEGTTYNDIVREIRSELAARYLCNEKISVSEVGFLLGYSEPSAFQRAFRSWYSCTPSEFRIQH